MNKFNLQALNVFRGAENVAFLRQKLIDVFIERDSTPAGITKINKYLSPENMQSFISNFADTAERQLLYSNLAYSGPAGGIDMRAPQVEAIVAALNRRFLTDRIAFIQQITAGSGVNHLPHAADGVIDINDGLTATSRTIVSNSPREFINDKDSGLLNYEAVRGNDSSDLLQNWRKSAASSLRMTYRDDTVGQINMKDNLPNYGIVSNSKEGFQGRQRMDDSSKNGRVVIDSPVKNTCMLDCDNEKLAKDPGYFYGDKRMAVRSSPLEKKAMVNGFSEVDLRPTLPPGQQFKIDKSGKVVNISGDPSRAPFLLIDHDRILPENTMMYNDKKDFNGSVGWRTYKDGPLGNLYDLRTRCVTTPEPTTIVEAANLHNRPGDGDTTADYTNNGEKNKSVDIDASGEYSGEHVDRFLQNKYIQQMNSSTDYSNKDSSPTMNPYVDNIKVNHARRYPSLYYDQNCGQGPAPCGYKTTSNIVNYPPDQMKIMKEDFGWRPRGTPGPAIDAAIKSPTSPQSNLYLRDGIGVKPLMTLNDRIEGKSGRSISSAPMPQSEQRCFNAKEIGGKNCPDPQNNVKLWKDTWSVIADESNPAEFNRFLGKRINRTYGKVRPNNVCPPGGNNDACGVYTDEFDIKAQIINSIYRAEAGGPNGLINEDAMSAVGDRAIEQIPWWRRGIQNRWYDYDAEENVGGFEFGSMNRGYDMDSLNCRTGRNLPMGSCNKNSLANLSNAAGAKKIRDIIPNY